jgi:hypothetical protein
MHFELDSVWEFEFRGSCLENNTQVALDYVKVD